MPRAGCRHETHLSALPTADPDLRSLATARGTPGRPGATEVAEGGGSGRDRAGAAACKTAATRGKPHAAKGESGARAVEWPATRGEERLRARLRVSHRLAPAASRSPTEKRV